MEKSFLLLLPVVGVAALGYLSVRLDYVSQAAADGQTADSIIDALIQQVPVRAGVDEADEQVANVLRS